MQPRFPAADLEAALDHHGLTDRLRHVVTSEDARAYKPRPQMFLAALDLFRLASHEVVHVADSATSDVAGASRLGIPAVWVNRTARPLPTPRPTLDVRSLADLAALLD
jgi:2-haloacid dehalogenase